MTDIAEQALLVLQAYFLKPIEIDIKNTSFSLHSSNHGQCGKVQMANSFSATRSHKTESARNLLCNMSSRLAFFQNAPGMQF